MTRKGVGVRKWTMMVDLRLASTYVPALTCLIRTSILLLLLSRESIMRSTPALTGIGVALYVDRIVRPEVIFDSSALTCTIFVAHVINVCRSSSPVSLYDPVASPTASAAAPAFATNAFKASRAEAQTRLRRQMAPLLPTMEPAMMLYETRPPPRALVSNATFNETYPTSPPMLVVATAAAAGSTAQNPLLSSSSSSSSAWKMPSTKRAAMAASPSFNEAKTMPWAPAWLADLVYVLYIIACFMQIVDVDPLYMLCPASYCAINHYFGLVLLMLLGGGGSGGSSASSSFVVGADDLNTDVCASSAGASSCASTSHAGGNSRHHEQQQQQQQQHVHVNHGELHLDIPFMASSSSSSLSCSAPSGIALTYDHRRAIGFRRWFDFHRLVRAAIHDFSTSGATGSSSTYNNVVAASATLGGTGNSNIVRISSVVTHAVLAGMAMQVRVHVSTFMTPSRVMARGFVFYAYCVAWTYAVAIRDACISIRTYPYYINPMAHPSKTHVCKPFKSMHPQHDHDDEEEGNNMGDQGSDNMGWLERLAGILPAYVQPFAPCQLRFGVLLFADRWYFLAAAISLGFIVGERIHRVAFGQQCQQQVPQPFAHKSRGMAMVAAEAAGGGGGGSSIMSNSSSTSISSSRGVAREEHQENVRLIRTLKRKSPVRSPHLQPNVVSMHSNATAHRELNPTTVVAENGGMAASTRGRGDGAAADDLRLFHLAVSSSSSSSSNNTPAKKVVPSTSYMLPSQLLSTSRQLAEIDEERGMEQREQESHLHRKHQRQQQGGDEEEEDEVEEEEEEEDELVHMFRLARQQQQRQLGEML